MKTTKLDFQDRCPFCDYKLDAVTAGPENPDATPDPGDVTVCIKCAGVLIFGEGLRVRAATEQELAEVLANPELIKIIRAIEDLHPKHSV